MKIKTRQEFANELGIDRKTLYRWLRKKGVDLPKGLLCPLTQQQIKTTLGFDD